MMLDEHGKRTNFDLISKSLDPEQSMKETRIAILDKLLIS